MERFRFGADVSFAPREELLDRVTVAPLSASIFQGSPFQAAVFRVAPGGRIARHPASYPQILAVLEGPAR
jgi:quercetin dioxygenase-like cupin family protein